MSTARKTLAALAAFGLAMALASAARACSMIARTSLTEADAPLSMWNSAEQCRAMTCASVVLPAPGGP